MTESWNITILGATGAVGSALFDLLQERSFPINELYLLANGDKEGESRRFNGRSIMIENAEGFDWSRSQIAFFCASQQASARYVQEATDNGCIVIDSTGLFSTELDIPLIVPTVNPTDLANYRHRNIIAIAHSLTCQLLTILNPLIKQVGLTRLYLNCLLSASAYGKAAIDDLAGQSARLLNGLPIENTFFQKQLAFNMLPLCANEQEGVYEERHLIEETRRILQDDTLPMVVTCIQSPVFYGQAQMVHFEGIRALSANEARQQLQQEPGLQISEQNDYPTQVGEASGNHQVSIGCIRNDYGMPDMLQFWSVADNIQFGGALMAIQTAERLIQEYLD